MRKITFYLFIILCLLLTSCGDGGGGNGNGNGGNGEAVIPPSDDYLCFTANVDGCSISTTVVGSLTSTPSLEYSADKEIWTPFIINDTSVPLPNTDDKVYIRAKSANATFSGSAGWIKFVISGSVSASGNIMSLLEKECRVLSVPDYAFKFLFYNNTTLKTAPELPATTLGRYCYAEMLEGCSALTTAPDLPATNLADCCYFHMFSGCSSLTAVPTELPATNLATRCYEGMFYGCSSLTTAPELPATTLAMGCYYWMFYGCSNLNSITVNFTTWNDDYTSLWVYGVPSGGTFICPDGLPHINPTEFGNSRIPTGWTVNP